MGDRRKKEKGEGRLMRGEMREQINGNEENGGREDKGEGRKKKGREGGR